MKRETKMYNIPRGIGTCRLFDDNRNETNRKLYYIYFIFNVNFKCIYFAGCCCCTTMTTTATVYRANKNKDISIQFEFFFPLRVNDEWLPYIQNGEYKQTDRLTEGKKN